MKIYIAAPYAVRDRVMELAAELAGYGHECTSTWATSTRPITPGTVGPTHDVDYDQVQAHAQGDFDDIDRSDAVIMLTSSHASDHTDAPDAWLHTGGRHVEVGYALASGKPVVIIGEPENVFARTLCLGAYNLDSALEALSGEAVLTPTGRNEDRG